MERICRNVSLENIVKEIDGIVYEEEWRFIEGSNGTHQISSFGRVKKMSYVLKNGTIKPDFIKLASACKKKKYLRVHIPINGIDKTISVHRLVASAFLDKIEGKPDVNHKTGIKEENHYSQIEWCTKEENNDHAVRIGLAKRGRNIKPYVKIGRAHVIPHTKAVVNIETKEVFKSCKEVCEKKGFSLRTLRKKLAGEVANNTPYRYLGEEYKFVPPIKRVGKRKEDDPVGLFDMEWRLINTFKCINDASSCIGSSRDLILSFLRGESQFVKGYKFKRIDTNGFFINPIPFVSKRPPLKPKKEKGVVPPAKIVVKYNLEGVEIQRYPSALYVAKELGMDKRHFKNAIKKNKRNYYKGFVWKYAE